MDIFELQENQEASYPSLEEIKKAYSAIGNYFQVAIGSGKGMSYDFDLNEISDKYKLVPRTVYASIKFLEKEGYLMYHDAFFQPTRLMFTATPNELYDFQVRNPKLDQTIKTILRSYGGLFTEFSNINEDMLAGRCKMTTAELQKVLKKLHELELVHYTPHSGLPKISFIENRVDSKHLYLAPENYALLKKRSAEKINAVTHYVGHKNECRSRIILQYFNENNVQDCGQCDVCLHRKALKKNPAADTLKNQIQQLISSRKIHLEEMISLLYHFESEKVVDAVNELTDDGLIYLDEDKYLYNKI